MLIFTSVFFLNFFVTTDPVSDDKECCPILFSTNEFDVSYDPMLYQLYLGPMEYDYETGNFKFNSKQKVSMLEITLATGEELKLIVGGNKVHIDKNIFEYKDATVAFNFEGSNKNFDLYIDYR